MWHVRRSVWYFLFIKDKSYYLLSVFLLLSFSLSLEPCNFTNVDLILIFSRDRLCTSSMQIQIFHFLKIFLNYSSNFMFFSLAIMDISHIYIEKQYSHLLWTPKLTLKRCSKNRRLWWRFKKLMPVHCSKFSLACIMYYM